jgi:hypothetical protein
LTTRFERRHRVQTRMRLVPPLTTARTVWRFGWKRRGVTLWAWLMFRPNLGPLPQISHRLAMMDPELARLPWPFGPRSRLFRRARYRPPRTADANLEV